MSKVSEHETDSSIELNPHESRDRVAPSVEKIDSPPVQQVSLRLQAIVGLVWMVSQTLGTKIISIGGQVALAYLLLPEHFATIVLTYTVTAFARILENGGLREVLVYRAEKIHELASPAFWLALALGIGSSLLIVLAAPLASSIYSSREVHSLLMWLAINPIITSLATVPLAKIQSDHRFKILAGLAALQGVSQVLATVAFAWFGWGAFSFVFGTLVASLFNTSAAWLAYAPPIVANFGFGQWRFLWASTLSLSLVGLATTLIQQIDYMMLGIFEVPKVQIGYYFFAFGIASQASHILSQNIATVFLPLLCKIQSDPQRQLAASLSALRIIAALGIPLSFLQSGLVDASFHMFLPAKWWPAIPLAQVLSLGLGLNVLSSLCWSLLKSQGRFNTILYLNWLSAVPFVIGVALAAKFGTPLSVAWVSVGLCASYSPLILWLSIVRIGGTWTNVAEVFFTPTIAALVALVVALQAEMLIPDDSWSLIFRIATVAIVFSLSYLICLLLVKHPMPSELARIAWDQLPKKFKR